MNSKRTVWIILGLTAVIGLTAMLTGHDGFATTCLGAFIGFASGLLPEKKN